MRVMSWLGGSTSRPDTLLEFGAEGVKGFHRRRTIPGPESDLIDWFLQEVPLRTPRHHELTIFREPRLDSGFPDVVAVVWRPDIAEDWPSERSQLTNTDLRVMHYLAQTGPARMEELNSSFGGAEAVSIQRLEAASMIRVRGRQVYPRPIGRVFAIRGIVAVEAKVGKWDAVLSQAHLNTWFASESYVLVPRTPQTHHLAAATQLGLGVWAKDPKGPVRLAPALTHQVPRSYGSWLFNEWLWKAMTGRTERGCDG